MRSSDDKHRWGTAVRMLLVLLAIGFVCLLLFTASSSITNMPVYVRVPTNPPPQFASALGHNSNWFTSVPYADSIQKPVTEDEIRQIKSAISRTKTIGRFYRPYSIEIASPIEAEAEFWRRRTPRRISLSKTSGVWRVECFNQHGLYHFTTPPDFIDKLRSKLPFLSLMKQFDFIVLGSGIAGLSFALKVAAHGRVAIITK